MLLMAAFGAVSTAVAATGIFGVLAFMVTQRTREIGVRLALGARPTQIRRAFLLRGAWRLGTGITAGLAGAWALSRSVEGFLFEIQARDARVFIAVAAMLGVVGLCACWLPARRATQIDPLEALRSQ